jgi:hypothetical protein
MVGALQNDRFFRWFDSGDVYDIRLARKILEVMQATPHVRHWLPTRMHKFAKFAPVLADMQALTNVMVRPSSDSVTGDYLPGVHGSTIAPSLDAVPDGAKLCHAATNSGKCGPCRDCYSKTVPVVAYLAHGQSMPRVIKAARARFALTRNGAAA